MSKAIQIKWKPISQLILALLAIYTLKSCLDFLFAPRQPCLRFDPHTRQFFMAAVDARQRPYLANNTALIADLIAQNENQRARTSRRPYADTQTHPYRFTMRAAHLPFHRISLHAWVSALERTLQLGLNTVEIDVVWGVHETARGSLDFSQGSNDLDEFIKLVKNHNLLLLVRIDPYLRCSEYDFGGLPSWLLGEKDRASEPARLLDLSNVRFMFSLERFYKGMLPILERQQTVHGGPIVGILITNYAVNALELKTDIRSFPLHEFYNNEYVKFIEKSLAEYGIYEALVTSIPVCEYDRASMASKIEFKIIISKKDYFYLK
jgi:hypothetical protein